MSGAELRCRMIPYGSVIATCVAAAGCIVFFVNYDRGLTKFIAQVNAVYSAAQNKNLIDFSTKAITIPVSLGFSALAVAFLISSFICTVVIADILCRSSCRIFKNIQEPPVLLLQRPLPG
uniref:Col_cuticle_N domain-containing protein n=1 Tax=Steinernema glaseri TaxID=37863 RepID=A0A1I7ZTP2_9BILA